MKGESIDTPALNITVIKLTNYSSLIKQSLGIL